MAPVNTSGSLKEEEPYKEIIDRIECLQETHLKHFGALCNLLSQLHDKMAIIERKVDNIEGQVYTISINKEENKQNKEDDDHDSNSDKSRSY